MSIKLMALAWEADLPITEKMVLLCLCDYANDAGACWPAMDSLAHKCSIEPRSARRVIRRLEERGFVSTEIGKGRANQNVYTINFTGIKPDPVSPGPCVPRTLMHLKPDPDAPKTGPTVPQTIKNHQEPSTNIVRRPEGVSAEVWSDWKRVRKRPVTKTALRRIENEATKIGWTLAQAINEAASNSWQGFKAEWVKDTQNGKTGNSTQAAAQRARQLLGRN